jgi:4-hydroxyphenylpyruvate dioxygenase-like putative hemolysin
VQTAKIQDAAVDENKLSSSVAGNGLSGGAGTALAVSVDDTTIEINGDSLRLKDGGINADKMGSNSVNTSQLVADSVTAAKIGAAFYQEVFQVSGSSTSSFDLARALDTGFFSSAMVFKNGLNMLNMTALSDSATNNSEYAISNNGAGSVGRLTFGGNLENGDAVLVMYFT